MESGRLLATPNLSRSLASQGSRGRAPSWRQAKCPSDAPSVRGLRRHTYGIALVLPRNHSGVVPRLIA